VVDGVVFHTDRGSTYTATRFTGLCERVGVRQSMGSVGSCFDNAAAEAFFSTLEHEVLSRHHFTTRDQGPQDQRAWRQDFYNTRRRHSSAGLQAPDYHEKTTAEQLAAA
jgi:putative transposase